MQGRGKGGDRGVAGSSRPALQAAVRCVGGHNKLKTCKGCKGKPRMRVMREGEQGQGGCLFSASSFGFSLPTKCFPIKR